MQIQNISQIFFKKSQDIKDICMTAAKEIAITKASDEFQHFVDFLEKGDAKIVPSENLKSRGVL